MRCDIGRLQAYVDGALAVEERTVVVDHLADCAACRENLAVLRRRGREVTTHLTVLDPQPHEMADVAQALTRFRARVQPPQPFGSPLRQAHDNTHTPRDGRS